MPKIFRDNGLSLAALLLFLLALAGQIAAGRGEYNEEQQEHGQQPVGMVEYLETSHFGEATFENWESEFLQMGLFVILTAFLIQRGAADSHKPPDEEGAGEEPMREDPAKHRKDPNAPWPVRRGGIALALYRNSLSTVLLLLFFITLALHAATGAREYSQDQLAHGGTPVTTLQYLHTARFWFESFQNWQSEFLAVFTLTVLSIWLRQYGSPESKPVHAPHAQTGEE